MVGYAGRKVGVKPDLYKGVAVIGAILLGLFCGIDVHPCLGATPSNTNLAKQV